MKRSALLFTIGAVLALVGVSAAGADSIGPITFEPTAYTVGNINGQNGWMKTGAYDAAVVADASFAAAAGYGFGTQALRISNAVTSGSFGDQTFAPPLASAAGESTGNNHFEASFAIGTALATQQPGLALSVSPDDGSGRPDELPALRGSGRRRPRLLRRRHRHRPGRHDRDVQRAPTSRRSTARQAHTVRFPIDFAAGAGNDVVQDLPRRRPEGDRHDAGRTTTASTRSRPGTGNVVPADRTLLFREGGSVSRGAAHARQRLPRSTTSRYASSNVAPNGNGKNGKDACKHGGWRTFGNPSFKNQGRCVAHMNQLSKHGHGDGGGDDDDQGNHGNHGKSNH